MQGPDRVIYHGIVEATIGFQRGVAIVSQHLHSVRTIALLSTDVHAASLVHEAEYEAFRAQW